MSKQLKKQHSPKDNGVSVPKTEGEEKQIKRTKKHEAILKVKQIEEHIDILKKKNKYLQVKDDENRSKTIQHQRKMQQYEKIREQVKKDRDSLLKHSRLRMQQTEACKQRFHSFREQIEKKVAESALKFHLERAQNYAELKKEQQVNQSKVVQIKEVSIKQNKKKKKIVNEMEEASKNNIIKFKEMRQKQSNQFKESEYLSLMSKASNREKQLQKLAKIEEEMLKKNSESMQVSQAIRRRFNMMLGGEGRYLRLPQISLKNNSLTTRMSTEKTQVLTS